MKEFIKKNIIVVSCVSLFLIGIVAIIFYFNINKEVLNFDSSEDVSTLVGEKQKELAKEEEESKKKAAEDKKKEEEAKKKAEEEKNKKEEETKEQSGSATKKPTKPTTPPKKNENSSSNNTNSSSGGNNSSSQGQTSNVYSCSQAKSLQKEYLAQGKATGLSELGNNQCLLIIY